MNARRIDLKILLLSILIVLFFAGCGVKSPPSQSPTEVDQETTGQVKRTEEADESEPVLEEENMLPTNPPPLDEPTSTKEPTQIFPDPTQPAVISEGENDGMVSKVKADLASRLGVNPEEIIIVSVEAVTWNDSSLGCPSSGGNYLQVQTPGYKIILMIDGVEYTYHTDSAKNYLLCNNLSL